MNSEFWISQAKPSVVLAPMEGVTDFVMRQLLTSLGGFTHSVTEFLRITDLVPPPKVFLENCPEIQNLSKTKSKIPVQLQLLGGNPESLALSAQKAVSLGSKSIDLNFGCPAPTVNRHDGGATLLKYPDRIYEIVKSVRSAVPSEIPVSVKMRLGWEDINDIYKNADRAARAGSSWITVHARTRVQGYKPPVNWEVIGNLKKDLDIPVIANGDIWSLDDFKRCRDLTKCDHFMLGRGAVINPKLALDVSRELGLTEAQRATEFKSVVDSFIKISQTELQHEPYVVQKLKQWFKMIHTRSEFPPFEKIKTLQSIKEIETALI